MKGFRQSAANIGLSLALTAGAFAAAQIPPGLRLPPNGQQKPSAAIPVTSPLPASAPTVAGPLPQAPQQRVAAAPNPTHRARVDYVQGTLTIHADNSSLNQILREIARQAAIKITGGVTDERVFGTYGPADLPSILAILLDGTGSNMMLSGDTPDAPQVLTLTPRQGGPTPPSPEQTPENDDQDRTPAQDLPPQLTPRTADNPIGPSRPVSPPQPQPFTPPTTQPDATSTAAAPAAGTTTDQSPNGVKTPQQIYDQLMKLQSQQPKAPQ